MHKLNIEVSAFLDGLDHPLRIEIDKLRCIIINAIDGLRENIKWNGPNYCYQDADRITMKIQPPKQIQIIFHRGVQKLEQPEKKIIQTDSNILTWKENDRAIATFKTMADIENNEMDLIVIINNWIEATQYSHHK